MTSREGRIHDYFAFIDRSLEATSAKPDPPF